MEIVERRRANDSSLRGEARFRAIFARSSVGIALVDRDGYAIESNPALQRMLGYSSDELRRMAFYEFSHPEDIEPDATLFRDMLTGMSENYQIEKRYFRKSGEVMWGRLSVSLLREKEDGPAFGVAILEDITETRLAKQVLEEQLKFDAFLANLSARFINLPVDQLDAVIQDAQRNICEYLNIDVCTLWQLSTAHPDSLFLSHYHVPPDFPSVPKVMDGKESFPWCLEKLRKGESVILSRVTHAPAAAARDLESWQHYGLKSVLAFPLSAGGSATFGALGFNAISEERGWPAELVSRLRLVAQIFANALARKRAEQTLRESEARFRLLADSAPVLIWMAGADKRCTYFSLPWLEFTGRTLEQELGDGWLEGVHPEDQQRCVDTYVRAFDAHEPFSMDYRLRHHDGEYRWVMDNGIPLFGADQRFAGYIGSCIDITERKQAEETLTEARRFADNLIQTANVMIIGLDTEGNVTLFNPTAERLTGYTRSELEGKNWFELLVPRDKYPWVHQEFSRLLAGGLPKSFQNPILTKSGEERFIAWSNNELVRDGRTIGTVSFGIDITEERQAQERLRESKALIKAVFSSLYGHVAVLDRDGHILAVNDAWTHFAEENQGGFSAVGVGVNYLDVCQRAMTAGDAIAGKALAGIKSVLNGECEEFVTEYPCASSTQTLWFEMVVHPLRRPEGGAVVTHVNISGRRQAETEAHNLRHELSHFARVAMMGELTTSLAHELNQPLAAILSNTQTVQRLLDHNPPDMTEIRAILADIVSDDQRAGDIIRGVRSLLRKNELNFRPLDINSVILEVIGLIRSDALIKNVAIALRLTPDIPNVRGDRIQLQQLILNLVINALDAMRNGPVRERRLEIATMQIDARSVQVAVQDSGMGIPPDRLEKVFEPFFTEKPQGMGMGLAICRSIVHMHGGRIWAANNAGYGATFRFILPIDEDSIS